MALKGRWPPRWARKLNGLGQKQKPRSPVSLVLEASQLWAWPWDQVVAREFLEFANKAWPTSPSVETLPARSGWFWRAPLLAEVEFPSVLPQPACARAPVAENVAVWPPDAPEPVTVRLQVSSSSLLPLSFRGPPLPLICHAHSCKPTTLPSGSLFAVAPWMLSLESRDSPTLAFSVLWILPLPAPSVLAFPRALTPTPFMLSLDVLTTLQDISYT